MACIPSASHALTTNVQRKADVESSAVVELTLPDALFKALGIAAHNNGRSIEAEIISNLSTDFLVRAHASMDSTTALAAVAVVLGIDGSAQTPAASDR